MLPDFLIKGRLSDRSRFFPLVWVDLDKFGVGGDLEAYRFKVLITRFCLLQADASRTSFS